MRYLITTAFVALTLSACASMPTASESGYAVKLNGVETNTERSSTLKYIVPAILVGGAVIAGIVLTSGDSEPSSIDPENFQRCIASGIPEPECRRLITG